jgi:class 3 adenylate cyclase/putative methionine-R-sulfoxide reductase with GAF domain
MKYHKLKKLLNKQKTTRLLGDFLNITPGVSACLVVDISGKCVMGYPNRAEEDFSPLMENLSDGGHITIKSPHIGSPIRIDEEMVGMVVVQSQDVDLSHRLVQAVQCLSSILAQFVSFRLEKREIALDALDKYREITLLYMIGETISSCLDVDQIANLVLETNQSFIKAENSSVMLLDRETRELEIKAASGMEQYVKAALKEGVGIAGLVVQTGQPEILNEPQADPRFVQPTGFVRSLLCVPMKAQEKVLGVINVSNKLSGEMFTAADEKLLMTLASQAAVAIENAHLVAELQEKNQELEASLRKVELLEKAKSHLKKFVPQSVQKLIEDNPDAPELDKQKKDVSILFLDIAGYTRISDFLDQERVNYLIERYFSSFLDDIHRNDGDINETAGDGLMIIFQNSDPATHAQQAAGTALAIRNKTQQINADLDGQYDPVQVNIGINSGTASVGSAKFEGITGTRWTYTASGMVTNLAARIAEFATEGSILVGERTVRQLSDQFVLEDLGQQQFKNVREPACVFRLLEKKGDRCEQENSHCR